MDIEAWNEVEGSGLRTHGPKLRVPEPPKYVEQWAFGLYLEVLGYYFTYFWGLGSTRP